jgi:hypothetical protein
MRTRWPFLFAALLLLPVGLATSASGAAGQAAKVAVSGPANTWVSTGSMAVARSGHTATLLPDGKVLVAGGATASAELYDPARGRWSPTGSLSVARSDATATLLTDGDVLVTGGCCNAAGNGYKTAELYDPSTGTWAPTGSMTTGRLGQTGTLLPDGTCSSPVGSGAPPAAGRLPSSTP